MNYTEKYHLPQWVKEDRIMMEDFNEAMAGIEAGIAKAAEKPYAVGSYVGTGEVQDIYVGFRPSVVLIQGYYTSTSNPSNNNYDFITTGHLFPGKVGLTETGFRLGASDTSYPRANEQYHKYVYVALK